MHVIGSLLCKMIWADVHDVRTELHASSHSAHYNFAMLAHALRSDTLITNTAVHISPETPAPALMCTMLFVRDVLDPVYAKQHGTFLCGYAGAVETELVPVAALDPEVPGYSHTVRHSSCASPGTSGLMSTAASDVEAPDRPYFLQHGIPLVPLQGLLG